MSDAGDPLEKLGQLIDFEIFRTDLEVALDYQSGPQGGRPPLDVVMMFKVLVLQALYNLSDPQAEYQILDRRSFGQLLGAGQIEFYNRQRPHTAHGGKTPDMIYWASKRKNETGQPMQNVA